jgi:hypothetical protein
MIEQQLINAFMKLTAKVGAGALVKELIKSVDENGNPKHWTTSEMQHAIDFINHKVDTFGKNEAQEIIQTLHHKFNIQPGEMKDNVLTETSGVQGLQ